MTKLKDISEKIKHIRKVQNFRQNDLAEQIGISHRHFQTIESGESDFKVSFLGKLSEVLKVPGCYFIYPHETTLNHVGIHCHGEMLDLLPVSIAVASAEGAVVYKNKAFQNSIGNIKTIEELNLEMKDRITLNSYLSLMGQASEISLDLPKDRSPDTKQLKLILKKIENKNESRTTGFLLVIT